MTSFGIRNGRMMPEEPGVGRVEHRSIIRSITRGGLLSISLH